MRCDVSVGVGLSVNVGWALAEILVYTDADACLCSSSNVHLKVNPLLWHNESYMIKLPVVL